MLYCLSQILSLIDKIISPIVRFIHLKIFIYILIKRLPSGFYLKSRNSILTPQYFSGLWSDIDIAVITEDLEKYSSTDLRKYLSEVKSFYPWLGEVEIYSTLEWEELQDLKSEWSGWYDKARQVRKYFWGKTMKNTSGFEKLKRQRSLRIIKNKLGYSDRKIEEAITLTFISLSKLKPHESVVSCPSYFHDYFQTWIILDLEDLREGVRLSSYDAWSLAHYYPLEAYWKKILLEKESQLSKNAIYRALIRIEQLELTGAFRGSLNLPDWFEKRMDDLKNQLS
jgi:hypothetical protein